MFGTVGLRCGLLSSIWWWLMLCCLVASVASFSCPWPCPDPPRCFGEVDSSTCTYGVQPDTAGCNCGCTYCARGPDEQCGVDDGACGEGLECVGEAPPDPGLCMFVTDPPEATRATTDAPTARTTVSTTPSSTTTPPVTASPSPSVTSTISTPPGRTTSPSTDHESTTAAGSPADGCSQQPTVPSSAVGEEDASDCRQKCSVSFCNDTRKQRICSARGMEFSRVEARGTCQDTSCRACFLQVPPTGISSCTACGSPPTKRCLSTYYKCIRNSVFGTPLLLALDSPEALAHPLGRIVCHVPQVIQSPDT